MDVRGSDMHYAPYCYHIYMSPFIRGNYMNIFQSLSEGHSFWAFLVAPRTVDNVGRIFGAEVGHNMRAMNSL